MNAHVLFEKMRPDGLFPEIFKNKDVKQNQFVRIIKGNAALCHFGADDGLPEDIRRKKGADGQMPCGLMPYCLFFVRSAIVRSHLAT